MSKKKNLDFKKNFSELELIVQELETIDDIEEAMKKYKTGMTLVADLENYLETKKNEIAVLTNEE